MDQESEGERALKRFLAPLGLDLDWGVSDIVPGRRLDALERRLLLCFEYDGRGSHVLPTDRDSDGLRDLECKARGVEVLRITHGMITQAQQDTLRSVAEVVRRRSAELIGTWA